MKFSPFSSYFLSLKSEYFPRTPSICVPLSLRKNKFHTDTKQNVKLQFYLF
jgi:hypothetical protein